MAVLPVRKIAVAGVLSALAVVLGLTRIGYIPWFTGTSVTVLHLPVIIGALLEGPVVGLVIGAIFGVTSVFQAALSGLAGDALFANPLIAVLPRLFIGPVAYAVYRLVAGRPAARPAVARELAAIGAGAALGSLTNTALVIGAIGLFGGVPWATLLPLAVANAPPEAIVAVVLALAVVAVWRRLPVSGGKARLAGEE
jgi:uncharacterized membrane protein